MNEIDFRIWLSENNISKKVQSDMVCRLKKLQRELNNCDLDDCYKKDRCERLLKIFYNKGINMESEKYEAADLPFGKYQLSAYKYALNKYIDFLDAAQS